MGDFNFNGLHLQKFVEASLHVSVLARFAIMMSQHFTNTLNGDEEESVNLTSLTVTLIIERRSFLAHPVLMASCLI